MTGVITPGTKGTVFLCHNSMDKPLVQRLGKLLELNGVNPWMDERNLQAGTPWLKELHEALVQSQAVVVCLGPNGVGKYQEEEIALATQRRIEAGGLLIPVILPNCGDFNPDFPAWLGTSQVLDLRKDGSGRDPFGRLLKRIDGRDEGGHYRPSVLVLKNESEPTSAETWRRIASECGNTLRRVRTIDGNEPLLGQALEDALRSSDVLVSLLSPDSYKPLPGELFGEGIARGARQLANRLGIPTVQWRSDTMALPEDPTQIDRFRSTDTETCLPAELAKHALEKAEEQFTRRRLEAGRKQLSEGKRQVVIGYPVKAKDGKRFVRQVAEKLEQNPIECSSPPKWEFVLGLLEQDPSLFEALVVVLTGDDDWLCDCTDALQKLKHKRQNSLPRVRAFLHKVDHPDDADPIPLRLEEFEEYFGISEIPKLASKIVNQE